MANLSVPQSEKGLLQQEEKNDSVANPSLKSTEEYHLRYAFQFIAVALLVSIMYFVLPIICPCSDESLNGTAAWTQERTITTWNPKNVFNRMSVQTTIKRVHLELEDNVKAHMDCFYIRSNAGTKKPPLSIVCPLKAPTKTNANDVEVYRKSSILTNGTLISSTIYTVSANGELQAKKEIIPASTRFEYIGKKPVSDPTEASTVIPAASDKGLVDAKLFNIRKLGKSAVTEMEKIKGSAPMNHAVIKLIEDTAAREPITQMPAPAAAPEFDETKMTSTSEREKLIDFNTVGVLKLVREANNASDSETKDNASTLEGNRAGKLIFTALKATTALDTTTGSTNGKPRDMTTSTIAAAPKNAKDIEEAATSGTTTLVSASETGKQLDVDTKDAGAIAAVAAAEEKQADPADRQQQQSDKVLWKYLNDLRKIQIIGKLNEKNVASRFSSSNTVAG